MKKIKNHPKKAWSIGKLNETCEEISKRWSNSKLSKYVKELESKANEILQNTDQKDVQHIN